MINRVFPLVLVIVLALASAGCQVIGNIFQAGVVVGVLVLVLVLGLVGWLLSRLF